METKEIIESLRALAKSLCDECYGNCEVGNEADFCDSDLQNMAAYRLEQLEKELQAAREKTHVSDVEHRRPSAYWAHQAGQEFSTCSNCRYPVSYWWGMSNYCPHCGRKMEEKRSELNWPKLK